MIKAIFFDIDGTLIPHGEMEIPQSVLNALRELKNQGVKLFIATGRPPMSIKHVTDQFEFDGFLTANGQYCFNKETIIHEKYIEKESLELLLPYMIENKISVLFARLDKCFRTGYETFFEKTWPIYDKETICDEKIVQLMAEIKPEEDEEFLKHLPGCKSARWTDAFADIIPIEGGKEYGINKIIEHYNISLDEVMAIGDGGNDITMLRHVPHSVAMGNAKDEVKANASYITTHILDDGIINAFKHFNLLDENFKG